MEPDWNGFNLDESFFSFIDYLQDKGFRYLGRGSFRRAYGRGNTIIKVPQNTDGLMDNMVEHRAYHTYFNRPTPLGVYLAPCRLLHNGCLMMPRVEKVTYESDYPMWSMLVDGDQVGWYKGRVVAYDYALDLPERFGWEKEWNKFSEWFNNDEWARRRPHIEDAVRRLTEQAERMNGYAER